MQRVRLILREKVKKPPQCNMPLALLDEKSDVVLKSKREKTSVTLNSTTFSLLANELLPEELVLHILSYLTLKERMQSVKPLNKYFYRLTNDQLLWKHDCIKAGLTIPELAFATDYNYRKLYFQERNRGFIVLDVSMDRGKQNRIKINSEIEDTLVKSLTNQKVLKVFTRKNLDEYLKDRKSSAGLVSIVYEIMLGSHLISHTSGSTKNDSNSNRIPFLYVTEHIIMRKHITTITMMNTEEKKLEKRLPGLRK